MTDHNHFSFIGRLVRDCEIRYTKTGTAVVNFAIAVNEKFGEKEYANFFDIILWGNLGVALEKYLTKGQQLLVAGRVKQDRWQHEGKNYNKVRFVAKDVQLVGSKSGTTGVNNSQPEVNDPWKEEAEQTGAMSSDDDVPF